MKNLETIAAEFNLFPQGNIPETHKEYFKNRIQGKIIDVPESFKSLKGFEWGIFWKCSKDTNYKNEISYYIENSYILIKGDSDLIFMLSSNKGKYYLYPYYGLINKLEKVSHYKREEAVKNLKEPNHIGVFTDKKVLDWINYRTEWYNILSNLANETSNKVAELIQEIKDFAANCGGKYSSYSDNYYVETPLFYVTFNIVKESAYMSKKIEFKGSLNDIIKISK